MTSHYRHLILSAIIGAGLAAALPAQADPPPWAPAHGHRAKQQREYHYVYYPEQRVYYEPQQRVWFWMSGTSWQFGVNLPSQYRVYDNGGVQLTLQTDRPYVEHVYVEEHYGRPWRKKHHHEDRRHDDEHGHGHGHH